MRFNKTYLYICFVVCLCISFGFQLCMYVCSHSPKFPVEKPAHIHSVRSPVKNHHSTVEKTSHIHSVRSPVKNHHSTVEKTSRIHSVRSPVKNTMEKPARIPINKYYENNRLPTIHAVISVRIYKDDKPKWSLFELDQWIEYMIYAGVTKFYLYDTHMTQSESLKTWAHKWADVLVYHDWGMYAHPFSIQGTQVRAYQHAIDHYGANSDWQIAYDMDEYPFSQQDRSRDFLRRKVHELDDVGISELSLQNYVFVGKPCHGDERVIQRITRRTPSKINNLDKPIYKPSHTKAQLHHNTLRSGRSKDVNPTVLRTNHYWGLRLQNWGLPCPRGECWSEEDMLKKTMTDTSAIVIADALDTMFSK